MFNKYLLSSFVPGIFFSRYGSIECALDYCLPFHGLKSKASEFQSVCVATVGTSLLF